MTVLQARSFFLVCECILFVPSRPPLHLLETVSVEVSCFMLLGCSCHWRTPKPRFSNEPIQDYGDL